MGKALVDKVRCSKAASLRQNLSHNVAIKVQSPIKWVGGKRKQLQFIIPKILTKLKNSNNYFEPFVGGGSVIIELLKQCWMNKIFHPSFFCYDINPILISMFNEIKATHNNWLKNWRSLKIKKMKTDTMWFVKNITRNHPLISLFTWIKLVFVVCTK